MHHAGNYYSHLVTTNYERMRSVVVHEQNAFYHLIRSIRKVALEHFYNLFRDIHWHSI